MEEHFPHHNWLIAIFLLLTVGSVGHIMFTPSIYQFVTTPRSRPPSGDINDDQEVIINPRRACTRVTVVVLCVCPSPVLAASAYIYTCNQ